MQNAPLWGFLLLLCFFVERVLANRWVVLLELEFVFDTLFVTTIPTDVLGFRAPYFYEMLFLWHGLYSTAFASCGQVRALLEKSTVPVRRLFYTLNRATVYFLGIPGATVCTTTTAISRPTILNVVV